MFTSMDHFNFVFVYIAEADCVHDSDNGKTQHTSCMLRGKSSRGNRTRFIFSPFFGHLSCGLLGSDEPSSREGDVRWKWISTGIKFFSFRSEYDRKSMRTVSYGVLSFGDVTTSKVRD